MSRNNFDLSKFCDDQEAIELTQCRVDEIPDLSRFAKLELLGFRKNLLTSINGNAAHATLTELDQYGNQITEIRGLEKLVNLEALDLSYNYLRKIEEFIMATLNRLKLTDAAKNSIASLCHLDHLQQLEDLWLDDNKISKWAEVRKLAKLAKLKTVYLEGNPVQTQDRNNYRRKLILTLHQIAQVDATPYR